MKKSSFFLILFLILFTFKGFAYESGKINCENIGLMETTDINSTVVEILKKNDTVTILNRYQEYLELKSPSGRTGWINSFFVNQQPEKTFLNTCGSNINVRLSPSTSSKIMGQIKPGETAVYLDTFHSWYVLDYKGMEVFAASWLGDVVSNGNSTVCFIDGTINIRNSPSLYGQVVSRGQKYSSYPFYGEEKGWFKLGLDSGYGYAAGWLMSYGENYYIDGVKEYKYTTDNLRMRSGPTLGDSIITVLPIATKIRVLKTDDKWDWIITKEGLTGYCYNEYFLGYKPLKGKTILLNPGHGGKDPGAISQSGLMEKEVNLKVAFKTKKILEYYGADVKMTRTTDVYITRPDRANMATQLNPDIFFSIHHNALNNNNYFGMSTYYDTKNNSSGRSSKLLAEAIYDSVVGINSIYRDGIYDRNFEVLRSSNITAALIEIGFMSNEWEEKNINNDSFQDEAARKISEGILDYFMFDE
jgi:N-acetylmuramoyl-L-alanine amidase